MVFPEAQVRTEELLPLRDSLRRAVSAVAAVLLQTAVSEVWECSWVRMGMTEPCLQERLHPNADVAEDPTTETELLLPRQTGLLRGHLLRYPVQAAAAVPVIQVHSQKQEAAAVTARS